MSESHPFRACIRQTIGVISLFVLSLPAVAAQRLSFDENKTHSARFILSLEQPIETLAQQKQLLNNLSSALDTHVDWVKNASGETSIVRVARPTMYTSHKLWQKRLAQQIERLPFVRATSLDAKLTTYANVNDPLFDSQWQLHDSAVHRASLDMERAWDITHGSANVVVAIIDTGVHYANPDLAGRLLPGYDFVSELSLAVPNDVNVPNELEFLRSNDGDGRDADAEDPGDAINAEHLTTFDSLQIECATSNSTWHGTAMASIVAANANDGLGMVGIDWHAQILPVRAIGRCGGRRSDMLDAIRWAAGVNDPALPPNPTPARIINLSLGIEDLCSEADQHAIDDAIAAGAIIVAAVGNSGRNTNSNPSSPSHCQNVLGVMAIDEKGFRAGYSNIGRDADIAAPGGTLSPSDYNILVSNNTGSDAPSNAYNYRSATGTSVATPHVAGVLALMLSVQPDISNTEAITLLLESARSFPKDNSEFDCTAELCGSGILDAYTAVLATQLYEPGTLNDSPALGAAQSVPVSVGHFQGFGCSTMPLPTNGRSATSLWILMLLLLPHWPSMLLRFGAVFKTTRKSNTETSTRLATGC